MKFKRYIRILTAMIVTISTVVVAPVSHATTEFETLWPTPAIAADPTKSGSPQWVSPDGQYVGMVINDQNNLNRQAWLLNRATGVGGQLSTITASHAYMMEFSDDMHQMLYWNMDDPNDRKLWLQDRTIGTEIQLGNGGVNSMLSYPDRLRLISKDGTKVVFEATNFLGLPNIPTGSTNAYLYDVATGTSTLIDDPTTGRVNGAAISGNGRYVIYSKQDTSVTAGSKVYRQDLVTGEQVLVGTGTYCYRDTLALSNDGSMATYNCRHGSKLIDLATMDYFTLQSSENVAGITNDNQHFLLRNNLYDWSTKQPTAVSQESRFSAVRLTEDGKRIIGMLEVYPHDGIGTTYQPVMIKSPLADSTAPVITPELSSTPDANGWNNTPVTLTWNITDPESTIDSTTGCDPVTVSATLGTTYTCSATSEGGTASKSITVKVDVTAPVVTSQLSPAPNAAGWNNTSTTLTWSTSDPESPITNTSNCDPVTITNNTAGTSYTCTATSSGGTTTQTSSVKLDSTAPTISTPTMTGGVTLPFLGTIFTSNSTTINTTVADALSGVARAEYYFDIDPGQGNGVALSVSGNTATANASLTGLSGQHTLHVRSQDAAGNWSTVQNFTFRRIGQ